MVEVEGVGRLVDTLNAASDQLDDLAIADQRVGSLVAVAVRRTAPKRTGALSDSTKVSIVGGLVEVTAGGGNVDYAVPVHKRDPWMVRAAKATQGDIIRTYTEEAARAVDQIKGA